MTKGLANRCDRLIQPSCQHGRLLIRAFDVLRVSLGLQHLATTVETGGADVVTQVHFTGGGLNGGTWSGQRVVRTVHATLGRRFFVLLNGHDGLRKPGTKARWVCQTAPLPAQTPFQRL